jgi:hypothetical protein
LLIRIDDDAVRDFRQAKNLVCGEVRVFYTFICTYVDKIGHLIGQKNDAMRCIPLIGLYNTPYYDVKINTYTVIPCQ